MKNDSYCKILLTDFGVKIEDYTIEEFSLSDLFHSPVDTSLEYQPNININDILNAYDYKYTLISPRSLSRYAFYQKNYIIEFKLIDNLDKYNAD